MTPTETNLFHALLNAEAYLAEGRVHHAHQVIHNAITMHRAQLSQAAPVAEPPKSDDRNWFPDGARFHVGGAPGLNAGETPEVLSRGYEVKCLNHAAGGTLCTAPCGDPDCVVPWPPETAA